MGLGAAVPRDAGHAGRRDPQGCMREILAWDSVRRVTSEWVQATRVVDLASQF
jgi:hypothetical protein